MKELIDYLKAQFPNAVVFPSCDKDFICMRTVLGHSNFGKNSSGEQVIVPITSTEKFHVDTIRLIFLKTQS